jgi:hypothetical protein
VGEGVGQRGPERWIGRSYCRLKALWCCRERGLWRNDRLDREEQEDEQRLREVVCEGGSVDICCDDSPYDEAARSCLRPFHTVSPRTRVNKARGRRC